MGIQVETKRLILRLFEITDAKRVQTLAGNEEVARTTLSIPHPYPDGAAEAWIEHTLSANQKGKTYSLAMVLKEDRLFIGCVSLDVSNNENQAELGYWVGRPYWGQGYATEAARKVMDFGFKELHLDRIFAAAMKNNPASCKVLQKIGMKPLDGLSKQVLKAGVWYDINHYELTKPGNH